MSICFFKSVNILTDRGRSLRIFVQAFWNAKWALLVSVIVLGGIYGGIMTPTEAAAVAALYGLVVGLFIYGELSFEKMWASCVEAAQTSSVIIVLMVKNLSLTPPTNFIFCSKIRVKF